MIAEAVPYAEARGIDFALLTRSEAFSIVIS
jgi:hypothetical protein